ncbi:MAG: M23 family metallopeptidase [Patescibacteria group bacterium]
MNTKMVLAEDLGKNSIIFSLAQGDEFSEITEEALQPIKGHNKDKNIFEKIVETEEENNMLENDSATSTPTTTTGSIFDSTLTRNTQILSKPIEGENIMLAKENSILTDALTKTSSPETESVPKPREEIIQYTVTGGDTISSIARQFGVSINTILWENKLSGLSIIRPGDTLIILPTSGVSHTVAKNETLSSIAKEYSAEIDELLAYNKLVSDKQLQIGQKLIVPGGSITPPTRSVRSVTSVFSSSPSVGSATSRIGGFIWPTVSKKITQYYHWRHHGLDIGSKPGLPIYASMAGVVTKAGWSTGYGYNVILDHGGGKRTLYAHMSKIYVNKGQEVNQGLPIGAIGSTGWSTGPHLHFEIMINGSKVNPLSYL